ncbi:molybdopterin cofactor-binding domain-containing protein [Pannonibacter sp. Pt2-lr]
MTCAAAAPIWKSSPPSSAPPSSCAEAPHEPRRPALIIHEDRPNGRAVYLHLAADGSATGFNGHVDLGTGIETALAQIVAEELDLPLGSVRMVLGRRR